MKKIVDLMSESTHRIWLLVSTAFLFFVFEGCSPTKSNFNFDDYCASNQEQIVDHLKNTLHADTAYIEFLGFFNEGDFEKAFPDGSMARQGNTKASVALIMNEYEEVHELLNDHYDESAPYFLIYYTAEFNHSGNGLEEAGISSEDLIDYSKGINRSGAEMLHKNVGNYSYDQREYHTILATIIDGEFTIVSNGVQKMGAAELEYAIGSTLAPDYDKFENILRRERTPNLYKEEVEFYAEYYYGSSNVKKLWEFNSSENLLEKIVSNTELKKWFIQYWSSSLSYSNHLRPKDFLERQGSSPPKLSHADSVLLKTRDVFSSWLANDLDHDYVPDYAELRDGTRPNDSLSFNEASQLDFILRCGLADWDGDGQSNITELFNKTDFRSPCFFKGERNNYTLFDPWSGEIQTVELDCDCDGISDRDDFDADNDGIFEYGPDAERDISIDIPKMPCNQQRYTNHYIIKLPWKSPADTIIGASASN
jgi:hypothetical protein